MGYKAELAMELEFRIFREDQRSLRAKGWQNLEPLSPTTSCYSIHRATGDDLLLARLRRHDGSARYSNRGIQPRARSRHV